MGAAVLKISDPAELLSAVPHLIGFEPVNSLVAVCLRSGRLAVTCRVDTPVESGDMVPILRAMQNVRADRVILIGWGPGAIVAGSVAVGEAELAAAGLDVEALLAFPGGRWRHASCDCCPEGGRPGVGQDAPAALALRVMRGTVPATSREALAARLAEGARAAGVRRVWASTASSGGREQLAAWGRILLAEEPVAEVPDVVLCRAARGALDPEVRDIVMVRLCPTVGSLSELGGALAAAAEGCLPVPWTDRPELEMAARVRLRWIEFCASLPAEHAAQVFGMLAIFSWWGGDGALALMASDRALAADPGCRLAQLADRLAELGLPPI